MFPQPRVKYDVIKNQKIVDMLQEAIALYGYQSVETSIIESAELFLTKAGDSILTRLFTFERYGRQLALRPEFTAAAAHHYAQQHMGVVRWQFSGAVFEDDPDDYRHNYQRLSVGAELIGMAGAVADAEVLAIAAQGAIQLKVVDWQLVVGHVGLTRQLLGQFALDNRTTRFLLNHLPTLKNPELGKVFVLQQLDKALLGREVLDHIADGMNEIDTQQMLDVLLDATQRGMTMGGRTRHDIARRLLQKRQRTADRMQIIAALDFLEQWSNIMLPTDQAFAAIKAFMPSSGEAQIILDEWQQIIALLEAYAVPLDCVRIQPALARSWDYYTGVVFELRTKSGIQLGGGGRYDELVSLIVGMQNNVPAVGLAFYVDQLAEAVLDFTENTLRAISVPVNVTNMVDAALWAYQLRSRGVIVSLLPEERAPNSAMLYVTGQSAQYRQQTYTLEQLDLLIANLD